MVVSKKIKSFLRNHPPETHWHVDSKKAYDTYYCLEKHCLLQPNSFLKALYSEAYSPASSYREEVLKHYNKFGARGRQWLKTQAFSDLKVFEKIAFKLPNTLQLQLANSSTIRYVQLFDLPKETSVFCNRGTSGIDGSTATAVGAAQISKTPTLLITGDLSFFYDLNGLWNNYIPNDFRILLINNSGGGIFRILPGEKDTSKYDTYFETIHQRNAKSIAKAFGFEYKSTRSLFGLNLKLNSFFKASSRPKILEIHTPRKLNDQILLDYFKSMV
jgi:2-succinyl-5-enolpyruvyl-6-hydroxy-3-cyclohexene-1-carboxylate synthase